MPSSQQRVPARSHIPFDILAEIIDYARPSYDNGSWTAALSSYAELATINSDAHSIVSAGLYHHLVLEGMGVFGDDHTQAGRRACTTVLHNPRIAALVSKCSIIYLASDDDSDPDVQCLAESIRRMSNLRSLALKDFSVPPALLQAICVLPSLESLSFRGCDLPASIFPLPRPAFHLREFVAIDSRLGEPNAVLDTFIHPPTLKALEMDAECTQAALDCFPWHDLTSLRKLYAEPMQEAGSHFCTILTHLSTLQDLGFIHAYESRPLDAHDFEHLSPLALLSLNRFLGPSSLAPLFTAGRSIETMVLDQRQDSAGICPRDVFATPEHSADGIQSIITSLVPSLEDVRALDLVVADAEACSIASLAKYSPSLSSLKLSCLESVPSLVSFGTVFTPFLSNNTSQRSLQSI